MPGPDYPLRHSVHRMIQKMQKGLASDLQVRLGPGLQPYRQPHRFSVNLQRPEWRPADQFICHPATGQVCHGDAVSSDLGQGVVRQGPPSYPVTTEGRHPPVLRGSCAVLHRGAERIRRVDLVDRHRVGPDLAHLDLQIENPAQHRAGDDLRGRAFGHNRPRL